MRRTAMRRGTTRLNPRSERTIERQPERDEVRRVTLTRAGHRCQMATLIPEVECWGPLDVHEIAGRGVQPGSQYDDGVTRAVCRAHHGWLHDQPRQAVERGLTVRSTYERDGGPRRIE